MDSSSSGSINIPDDICSHPTVIKGKCMVCLRRLPIRCGQAFDYIVKNMWLSTDEIARVRMEESERLLNEKKMVLVLDLDHTLLHTTVNQKYLKTQEELNSQHNSIPKPYLITKLRPYVHKFLKEASTMFEMYMYTMGRRHYARRMAAFLDPEMVYFKSRIIAYEDYEKEQKKSLDLVLKHERMVLILDDTIPVWRKQDQPNLIPVKRYIYFDTEFDNRTPSLSALKIDEDEITGELATILKKLQLIHRMFFNPKAEGDLAHRDVRLIKARANVLQGCTLFINTTDFDPEKSRRWMMMAEELGAICSKELCDSVTHVFTYNSVGRKMESQHTELDKKIFVHPSWLQACYDAVKRKAEKDFRPVVLVLSKLER
jgi:RNA polymerase II C-terminal domain phosphatase-like 3/4